MQRGVLYRKFQYKAHIGNEQSEEARHYKGDGNADKQGYECTPLRQHLVPDESKNDTQPHCNQRQHK